MKIYFVRHGETESLRIGRHMGGGQDDSLNDVGRSEALKVARSLDKDFDIIFTSPLKRAKETADILGAELDVPIKMREELAECDTGTLGGKLWSEIEKITHGKVVRGKLGGVDFTPYGGETYDDVVRRVERFCDEMKNEYADKKVLVVTHGGVIRIMHMLYGNEIREAPKLLAVTEFEI